MTGATEQGAESIEEVGPGSVLCRSVDALAQEVDDETIIMDLATEAYYGLNETGTQVWNALDGRTALASIVDELVERYDVSREVLMEDCINLVSALRDVGLIIPAGAAPGR